MAMTIDGHVAHPTDIWNYGSSEDRRRMDRLREWAQCLIVSRKTLEHDNMDLRVRTKLRAKHPRPVIVMQSPRPLRKGLNAAKYAATPGELWLSAAHQAPAVSELWSEIGADWQIHQHKQVDEIVKSLRQRGYERLLLEGGPSLNGLFFEHDLVDEFYLTILPIAWGGTTTDRSIVSSRPLPLQRFRLQSAEKRKNEMFLRYIRRRLPG
ncbi:MAG: dihydrofolate reductase family protein [Turneriella sp.]|nr:dihydrofolate reductase family protein [Turneriella sp.]